MNISVTIDVSKTIASLSRFQEQWRKSSEAAVKRTARSMMQRIVTKTLAPIDNSQAARPYIRTWRMLNGWKPAAGAVNAARGIRSLRITRSTRKDKSGPLAALDRTTAPLRGGGGNEGRFYFTQTPDSTSFEAVNDIPYALFVEDAGTWINPRENTRRPPYKIVANSVNETVPDFEKNIIAEWNEIP